MTERVFVKSLGGLSANNIRGLGEVLERIPTGWTGHLLKVRLDNGAEVQATSGEVFSATNVTMFRPRRAPVLPFPGGSGSAA